MDQSHRTQNFDIDGSIDYAVPADVPKDIGHILMMPQDLQRSRDPGDVQCFGRLRLVDGQERPLCASEFNFAFYTAGSEEQRSRGCLESRCLPEGVDNPK